MGRKPTEFPDGISTECDRIVVRFQWNGERIRESLSLPITPKNIERASRLRSEVITRIKYGNFTLNDFENYFPSSKRVQGLIQPDYFGPYAQQWLDAVEVSPNTRQEYKKILNKYWMPRFATRQLPLIAYSELRGAVNEIAWPTNKTRNNALIPLRGIFGMALEDEIIERDPTAKLKNLKHQKPPVDPFSRDEAELILAKLYEQFQGIEAIHAAYFEFAFFTGMRPSEMLALRWNDIDSREGYARVSKAQSKGRLNNRTKISEVRDVRLNERALHALEVVKPYTAEIGGCVFRSHRYGAEFKTEKSQRIIFTRALKALGIRHRKAYNTRHTYATMLLMSGVNINFVASQLGHSPIMTATVYSKWITGEADKAEMAKLNTSVMEGKNEEKISEKNGIGGKLAGTPRRSAQVIELKRRNWSGRQDLNLRPHAPQACALPGCATPRFIYRTLCIQGFSDLQTLAGSSGKRPLKRAAILTQPGGLVN